MLVNNNTVVHTGAAWNAVAPTLAPRFAPAPASAPAPAREKKGTARLKHEPELIGFLDDLLASRLGPAGTAAERADNDPGGAALMMRRGFMIEGVFDLNS